MVVLQEKSVCHQKPQDSSYRDHEYLQRVSFKPLAFEIIITDQSFENRPLGNINITKFHGSQACTDRPIAAKS